jgi:hypothetical protein
MDFRSAGCCRFFKGAFLALFFVTPTVLYILSHTSNSWITFEVLPGSLLRYEDDDAPEYIREIHDSLLVYNWTGLLEFGLWTYSLSPRVNGTLREPTVTKISSCYQSPSDSSHHRICPLLILVRSFAICAPIITFISAISVFGIMRRESLLSTRWDAIILSFFPSICGMVGWCIFHFMLGDDLSKSAEFLPIYTGRDLLWQTDTTVGSSQLFFLIAWTLQLFCGFLFSLSFCMCTGGRREERAPLLAW